MKILRRLQVPPMDTPSRDRNSCPLKSPATREGRSRQRFSHWVGRQREGEGGKLESMMAGALQCSSAPVDRLL